MDKTNVGLILEGGGMRGIYTAGVLDAFLEANLEFDGCLGVSAGSCHAASYLSKQKGRAYHTNVDYLEDWRYCSVRSLLKTGDFFGAKMLYDTIPNQLSLFDHDTFSKRRAWFRAVITNVETGEAEYPLLQDMNKDVIYLRASSSLPLLSRLVSIQGKKYLDGGISDSIPIEASINFGCQKNVILLTQCPEYRKKANPLMPIIQLKYRNYPKLVAKMAQRHLDYNATLDKIEALKKAGCVYVIQPQEPVKIGRLEKDKAKLNELYQLGLEDGKKHIQAIQAFMKD